MPARRADYYRRKAEECRAYAAAAKDSEVKESWQKLAAQWERLARGLDATAERARELAPAVGRDISGRTRAWLKTKNPNFERR